MTAKNEQRQRQRQRPRQIQGSFAALRMTEILGGVRLLRGRASLGGWSCLGRPGSAGGSDFGVEEFGEAGVLGDAVEVGVEAGLEAVLSVETDGLSEVVDAGVGVAGEAG